MTSTPSLSQRINISTRPLHTHLNALIFSLLPLALPPHTPDATKYLVGIAHISPIYEAFEGEFRLLLAQWEEEGGKGGHRDGIQEAKGTDDEKRSQKTRPRAEVIQALSKLYKPELERTSRLHWDISTLSQHPTTSNIIHVANGSAPPRLAGFAAHIHTTLPARPHLLLAYTWIFYMALFSGGRYIRAQLRQAGPAFWNSKLSAEKRADVDDQLSFWIFEGDQDGEDFRAEFKKRFIEVERCLTDVEREDVVQEAVYIMGAVIGVVEEIAHLVGSTERAAQAEFVAGYEAGTKGDGWVHDDCTKLRKGDGPSMQRLLLKHILPLGMVELMSEAAKVLMLGIESCRAAWDGRCESLGR